MILTLKKLVKVILLLDFVYIWSLNILISVSFEKHNQLVRRKFKMFFKIPFFTVFFKTWKSNWKENTVSFWNFENMSQEQFV